MGGTSGGMGGTSGGMGGTSGGMGGTSGGMGGPGGTSGGMGGPGGNSGILAMYDPYIPHMAEPSSEYLLGSHCSQVPSKTLLYSPATQDSHFPEEEEYSVPGAQAKRRQ